jgi:hypothetical protein
MKVSVWDTYVKREDGKWMHFDILVPSDLKNEKNILEYGTTYLKDKPSNTERIVSKQCRFCHVKQASKDMMTQINEKGFSIIEIEHCH